MLTFELAETDKHSTNDLLQPKNLRFLSRTNHMCAESNERMKIVTQLFIRWWSRPTGVVLQGRASNHHKVLW
jgi:hypothetical protein